MGYRVSRVIFLVARRDRPDTFTRPKGRRLFSFFLSLLFLSSSRDYRTTIPFSADSFPLPFCLMTLPLANKNDTEIGFRVSIANFFFFRLCLQFVNRMEFFFIDGDKRSFLRAVRVSVERGRAKESVAALVLFLNENAQLKEGRSNWSWLRKK